MLNSHPRYLEPRLIRGYCFVGEAFAGGGGGGPAAFDAAGDAAFDAAGDADAAAAGVGDSIRVTCEATTCQAPLFFA